MRVVDVQNPTSPVEIGAFEPGPAYEAWSVACSGDNAYLGYIEDSSAGIDVLDVQDPANPAEIGHCDMPGLPRQLVVAHGFAFVAADDSGLRVVDLENPQTPVEVGHWLLPDRAHGVDVSGVHVYMANRHSAGGVSNGLYVVDVSDPEYPTQAGHIETPGQALDVAVWGSLVVLADTGGGAAIFEECGGAIFFDGFESGDVSAWSELY